jgi:ribA/ribD-fused uncharacterized protein
MVNEIIPINTRNNTLYVGDTGNVKLTFKEPFNEFSKEPLNEGSRNRITYESPNDNIKLTFEETQNMLNNIQKILINSLFGASFDDSFDDSFDASFIISNDNRNEANKNEIEKIQEEIGKIQQDIEKIKKENEKTQKEIELFRLKQEKEKQEKQEKEKKEKEKQEKEKQEKERREKESPRFLAINGVITFKSISLEQPTARNAALRCLPNTAVSQFSIETGGIFERFYSVEHYLLYCKAKLYNHRYVLNYLKEKFEGYCPSFPDEKWENNLKVISKLNSFIDISDGEWDAVKESVLTRGILAKFTQSAAYKRVLLDTGDNILAYLTLDSYLGIGCEDYNGQSPNEWSGENVLGEVLMNVREFIRDML